MHHNLTVFVLKVHVVECQSWRPALYHLSNCCFRISATMPLSKEVVYLRDRTSSSDLMYGLNELRKQSILCNVHIKIGDDTYPAHKIVLIAQCEYFKAMFTSRFKKARNNRYVTLEGKKA